MARTRPKTTGDTSGSRTSSKETTSRGYKSTNKVDNSYDSAETNTPKPVGLGRGRGNREKTGNTSLLPGKKTCNTSLLIGLDTKEVKAGNTSLYSDNKSSKTGLSKEPAKAGYTTLSSSTKACKTGLSMGNSKVGVTNLNSNNRTISSSTQTSSSSTHNSGFQDALTTFNNIKSTPSTDFFKSYVKHDSTYQPKYKKFKCRPDPIQQEHLNKARLFHDWLNQPSSYPSEYYNFLHGSLNYWFAPNTGSKFTPDLSLKPFVPHPHMHPLYPKKFLKTPHIHQYQSYMLPSYENHKETIFFRVIGQWLQQI